MSSDSGGLGGFDLGGLVSGWFGYQGTKDTNETNREIAQANNEWSAQQYATRYQTMTKDLQAAGLNPMLAYSQSPGSAPTAQQVQFQNPVSSALEAYHRSNERDLIQEQVKQTEANTQVAATQAAKNQAEAELIRAQVHQTVASTGRVTYEIDKLKAEAQHTLSSIPNLEKYGRSLDAQTLKTLTAEIPYMSASTQRQIAESNLVPTLMRLNTLTGNKMDFEMPQHELKNEPYRLGSEFLHKLRAGLATGASGHSVYPSRSK